MKIVRPFHRRFHFRRIFSASVFTGVVFAIAWGVLHVMYIVPNDRRLELPFPDIREDVPARALAYDFLAHAEESRFRLSGTFSPHAESSSGGTASEGVLSPASTAGEIYESALAHLRRHPWVNADADYNGSSHVVTVSLGQEPAQVVRRRALYAPGSSEYEYALVVPPDAMMEFYYGIFSRIADPETVPGARFVVELLAGSDRAQVLFSTGLASEPTDSLSRWARFVRRVRGPFQAGCDISGDQWYLAQVDLKAWAGQTVRFRFRTEPLPAATPAEEGNGEFAVPASSSHAFWGEPALWAPPAGKNRPVDNLILIVLESLRSDYLTDRRILGNASPHLERIGREGVGFQRVYTNAVSSRLALPVLLSSRGAPQLAPAFSADGVSPAGKEEFYRNAGPSLAAALKSHGYRTIALGALDSIVDGLGPGTDWGFDEVHVFQRPGYDTVHACRRAIQWLSEHPRQEPFCLLLYFRDVPSTVVPPLRFWARSLVEIPWGRTGFLKWRYRAQLAYIEEYLGRFFDVLDAYKYWDRSLTAVVSTRGVEFRPRLLGGARAPASRSASGLPSSPHLSEDEIRVVWEMKHRSLPQGQLISEPVQLVDLAPTVLGILNLPVPQTFQGTALEISPRGFSRPPEDRRIFTSGEESKSLLAENHYKYIRPRFFYAPAPAGSAAAKPLGLPARTEELYDLWTDPREDHNLLRQDRSLLATLRRLMEEMDPDPVETRLVFWDLKGQTVTGSVETPGGDFRDFAASGSFARRGNQYDFEISSSSGTVRFQIWPPASSFVLRMKLGERVFSPEQIRVSKFGLPLFERSGVEWYDYNNFPWMEGLAGPQPGDQGPLVFFGRVHAPGYFSTAAPQAGLDVSAGQPLPSAAGGTP